VGKPTHETTSVDFTNETTFFAAIPVSEDRSIVGDWSRTLGVGGFESGHKWALWSRPLRRPPGASFALFIEAERRASRIEQRSLSVTAVAKR